MALTVISRPVGHKLNTTSVNAVIVDDGTGTARVYVAGGHGLTDGDYVYIISNFESYNGFKYVDSTSYDYFRIKENAEDDAIEFIQEADITFYVSALQHGWQSVHQPIVYELESDAYPINIAEETYTPITVVSQSDSNGNTRLNLSAAINSDPSALEYIEIVGEGELAGVYQILQVFQPWSFVINLAYDATNSFTGYQIVNYYNNYFIKVQVYAGLSSDNRWEDRKPYELAGTLKLIPGNDNRVKFSINELLKGYIETRNNLTLDTLPNNLDFYVQFYILYSQNHDTSDGETITISEGAFTSDQEQFEGHAVNAFMPFKSQNVSHLSDYINEDSLLANWLTLMTRPQMVIGRFFDISFLNQYNNTDIHVVIFKSSGGIVSQTETVVLENPGSGVMRVPIEVDTGFDQYCLQASTVGSPSVPDQTTPMSIEARSLWRHVGTGTDWVTGITSPTLALGTGGAQSSKILSFLFDTLDGHEYTVTIGLTSPDPFNLASPQMIIYIIDAGNNILYSESKSAPYNTNQSYTFDGISGGVRIGIRITTNGSSARNFVLASASGTDTEFGHAGTPAVTITEQICCDVISDCSTPSVENIHITWLNHLGGLEYFLFTARKDYGVNIEETAEQETNIFNQWPKSYGAFADTIRRETFRRSRDFITVRSQHVSKDDLLILQTIKQSPLVQIIYSRTNRRTILVDTDSFIKYTENDDTFSLQFTARFTNENPSQRI